MSLSNLPRNFIERASFIEELLSDQFEMNFGEKNTIDVSVNRLGSWCRYSSSGNWQQFFKRLKRDKLSVEFVLERFSSAKFKSDSVEPLWFIDAIWILDALTDKKINSIKNLSTNQEIPFFDIYKCLGFIAEKHMFNEVGDYSEKLFSEEALTDLRTNLYVRVSDLCSDAILDQFENFKSKRKANTDLTSVKRGLDNFLYSEFMTHMRDAGLKEMFDKKPVLLRLLAVIVRQWIHATKELIQRVHADHKKIYIFLNDLSCKNKVIGIDAGLSDFHNQGKSVAILEFENGQKIVYKPRNLGLDLFFDEFIQELNSHNFDIKLRAPKVLPANEYGWVEYISYIECDSDIQIKNFYKKLGSILSIFHILIGSDMHYENIIACGEDPVPIDIELLFQFSFLDTDQSTDDMSAIKKAASRTVDSVLGVGLLPNYLKSSSGQIVSTGGVGNGSRVIKEKKWINLNTDGIKYDWVQKEISNNNNLPKLENSKDLYALHLDDFVGGFRDYSIFLINLREKLGSDWIVKRANSLFARKVLKPTNFYAALINRLSDHRKMVDGVIWSAEADFISRFYDWNEEAEKIWPICKEERSALTELNIPYFYFPVIGGALRSMGSEICILDCNPALTRSFKRYQGLDEKELNWQCDVIRSTVNSATTYSSNILKIERLPDKELNGQDLFLKEALALGEILLSVSIKNKNSVAWVGMDWLGDSNFSQLSPLGFDFYNGSSGIAVFLAACGKQHNDSRFKTAAINAFTNLSDEIDGANSQRFSRTIGLGGGVGLGSIIYALTTMAEISDMDAFLCRAKKCIELINSDLIYSDKNLDVLSGVAGVILSLSKYYKFTNCDIALSKAIACGEYLLSVPRYHDGSVSSWRPKEFNGVPLTGLSHGASGFALSLFSLAKISGEKKFYDAGLECLHYENKIFSDDYCNWPDHRKGVPKDEIYKVSQWCNGAAGIGLSRLAISKLEIVDESMINKDIERALIAIKNYGKNSLDTLCCGQLGDIEFLFEIAVRNKDAELLKVVMGRMSSMIKKAHENGGFSFGAAQNNFHLSLFRGISGVGYTSLRLVNQSLPNILVWE
jgi:type 2 lantibiotic biosynthesis protein LanM